MIIIADAGSTKIEWALIGADKKCLVRLCSRGFNAAQASVSALSELIREDVPELLAGNCGNRVRLVSFYGAGCTGERCKAVGDVLLETFGAREAAVESDMLGAARALCGHSPGVACILGTGSNSCLYDGKRITANTPPMGFILGDEGSGAALGKSLLTKVFKRQLPAEIIELFEKAYPEATKDEIIARVYRGERPSAYLASFAPFLKENIGLAGISALVEDEFKRFFRMNIDAYDKAKSLPVNFIGSIAAHFAPQLRKAATDCGYTIGRIEQAPMDALIGYHSRE